MASVPDDTNFELNQHQVNLRLAEINGEPELARERLLRATSKEEHALWSVVHRQALIGQRPKGKGGCCGG
jgi:hypothetical protein